MINISKFTFIIIKKLLKKMLKGVIITVHKDINSIFRFMNYATINAISLFCTLSYKDNWNLFIMTSYRSKPLATAKKRPRKKPALNSLAKRRLKNCWKPATLLKMSFIIGTFQGLWLFHRSEHLFLRICFSGCFRVFVILVCQVQYKNPAM